jgi:hypothetical protein
LHLHPVDLLEVRLEIGPVNLARRDAEERRTIEAVRLAAAKLADKVLEQCVLVAAKVMCLFAAAQRASIERRRRFGGLELAARAERAAALRELRFERRHAENVGGGSARGVGVGARGGAFSFFFGRAAISTESSSDEERVSSSSSLSALFFRAPPFLLLYAAPVWSAAPCVTGEKRASRQRSHIGYARLPPQSALSLSDSIFAEQLTHQNSHTCSPK